MSDDLFAVPENCAFCGTRVPANATVCTGCGARRTWRRSGLKALAIAAGTWVIAFILFNVTFALVSSITKSETFIWTLSAIVGVGAWCLLTALLVRRTKRHVVWLRAGP